MRSIITILFCLFLQQIISQTTNAINLLSFATGFSDPVEITHAHDSRLFVVQRGGLIRILNANGTKNTIPFLNVSGLISTSGGEEGLLGLAFHPNYKNNRLFYLNYTNTSGNTVIAQYSVNALDSNVADTNGRIIMTIYQPFDNHNGGTIKFGSDGYLYIGMGDGGSGGDPGNRSQNLDTLLGKMLRIDIDTTASYKIPPSNPYVGTAGADEIWASGLRNPWKFSFDKNTSDLWIGDVGQNNFEEINKATITQSALNYGWRCYEANATFNTNGCGGISLYKAPLVSINHNSGACSITGGYVYRGFIYPNLFGKFLFTDFCRARIGLVDTNGSVTFSANFSGKNFSTFGENMAGELYVADYSGGVIFKITDNVVSSINDIQTNSFQVFPNPSKGLITVKSGLGFYAKEIYITDLNGKLLLTKRFSIGTEGKIEVSPLSKGFYKLSVLDNLNRISFHQLIIE